MEPSTTPRYTDQIPTWSPPIAPEAPPQFGGEPVDPNGTTDGAATQGTQRRVLRILAVGAVVLLVAGLGAWGLSQRSRADDWQQEAADLTTQRDDLNSQVSNLTDELESVANEKARVTDEREQLRQLVQLGPVVADAMSDCADANRTVAIEAIELIQSFPYGSTYPLESAVDDSTTKCDQANQMLSSFNTTIDGLAP